MLDMKLVRSNPELVKENIKKKFQDEKLPLVDEVLELDAQFRASKARGDELRQQRNTISKEIGKLMSQGKKDEAMALKEQVSKDAKRLEELEAMIKEMFFQGEISFNDEVYITNMRQKRALEEALESLNLVENSIEMGMPEDFFSIDLMNAYERLGSIIGEAVGEDLVNEIFSKFCTGK